MRTKNGASAQNARRDFLKLGAASALTTLCLPLDLVTKMEARADEAGADVVLRCCVMSDVHFNGSPDAREVNRFKRAIQFMYDYSADQSYKAFDALVVVGDMSNHGNEAELSLFKKTMDAAVRPGTKKLLCMGNHEFYGGNQDFWRQTFGVEPNARYEVNGYQFVALSPEKGTMQDGDYMYALDWFNQTLDEARAADPEKPIFVFQHYPVSPTVYGGRGRDDWGLEDLFDSLQRCPRVVNFSGHTHYPINDPRCAWQGCFSAFGTGTLSYLCHGNEGGKYESYPAGKEICGQFYVMEVRRDNSVTLKPYDLVTNSFFDVAYRVDKPGAIKDYLYTDERYTSYPIPVWPENAKIDVVETYEYGAVCEFNQAKSDAIIHSYAFELERLDSEKKWVDEGTQYFWSKYFERNPPERLKIELTSLEPESQYRVKVFATNPFLRNSASALEFEFQTPKDPNDVVDRNAERPDANVLDLSFVDGELRDSAKTANEKKHAVERVGSPKVEPEGDKEVAVFDGSANFFKIPCSDVDYRRLRRATIAARFKADGKRDKGVGAVFGNTEQRGIELSVNYENRTINFWASVNGQYKIASAPLTFDEYVDVFGVYDGTDVILYINGKEAARAAGKGALVHPTDKVVQAFCFGCDIAPGGGGSDFFTGKIERARLFSWALTAEQVANLVK